VCSTETDLIGQSRTATGAVRGKLALVQFGPIRPDRRAVEAIIEPFGAAMREAG
jgi:hypothetical protein